MTQDKKLSIDLTQEVRATVLSLTGRLDATTVGALDQAVQEQLKTGQNTLIFDCTNLSYISSAGLRSLLIAARLAKSAGGYVRLCALAPSIEELLQISGFNEIFDVRPTRAEALGSL